MPGSVIPSILVADAGSAVVTAQRVSSDGDTLELRADLLGPEDVRAVVAGDDRNWIVTARTDEQGGFFRGGEEDRAALLRAALEAGARWVDVEIDGGLADWADGPDAARTIVSLHGFRCTRDALRDAYTRLARTRADRIKLVPVPEAAAQTIELRDLLREAADPRLCAFGLGRAGAVSRLLALAWGSWGTYAAVRRAAETAAGQFTVAELEGIYRVREIDAETRLVALAGGDPILPGSPSPAMHNAGYRALGLNRRYLPLPCQAWAEVAGAASALGLEGLAVTMPFKRDAAAAAGELDEVAERSGAVNTFSLGPDAARGANTDGPAALARMRSRGLTDGDTVDVVGGGGTGRAVAAALATAGFRPTVWRRDPDAGEPPPAGVEQSALVDRKEGESDWLVNATPRRDAAPFGPGVPARKGVLDAVYGPRPTALIESARAAGLAAIDGFELLVAQAELQFRLQTGVEPPAGLFAECGQRYLDGLG